MNKQFIKIMIVLWSLIALFLTALLVYGITSGKGTNDIFSFGQWNTGSASVQKEEETSIDNCEKISLDFFSADIEISTSKESTLKIVQEARGTMKEAEKFSLARSGNTIEIKDGRSNLTFNIFGLGISDIKVKLSIPEGYNKDLEIKSASGNITFNSDMDLNNVKCTLSSGNINSGGSISASQISLKDTSGNINIDNLQVKTYDLSTSSGNIKIMSLYGSGQVKASSGNIIINYKDISEESTVEANSGNVILTVLKGISFEFYGKCSSGEINSTFDLNYKNKKGNEATAKVGEGPYKKINARTSSGNINISEAN